MRSKMTKKFSLLVVIVMLCTGCTASREFIIPENQLSNLESTRLDLNFGKQWDKHSYVKLCIQDRECHLLLDTADYHGTITLKTDIINEMGIQPVGKKSYRDAEGKKYYAREFIIPKIKLGDIEIPDVPTLEKVSGPQEFDGRIGLGLLRNFHMLIDYPNHGLTLYNKSKRPGLIDETQWHKYKLMGNLQVKIRLDGSRDYIVGLDTGSNTGMVPKKSYLAKDILKKYGLTDENKIINQRNGRIVYHYRIDDFSLPNYDLGEMEIIISDMAGYMGNGILGYDFFQNNIVYLDFTNNVIYLRKSEFSDI